MTPVQQRGATTGGGTQRGGRRAGGTGRERSFPDMDNAKGVAPDPAQAGGGAGGLEARGRPCAEVPALPRRRFPRLGRLRHCDTTEAHPASFCTRCGDFFARGDALWRHRNNSPSACIDMTPDEADSSAARPTTCTKSSRCGRSTAWRLARTSGRRFHRSSSRCFPSRRRKGAESSADSQRASRNREREKLVSSWFLYP